MGILSTFAVAVPSFALAQLLGADDGTTLALRWSCNMPVFIAGSGVGFLAALAFYRQRSALAYWYGQIAMSISPAHEKSDGGSPKSGIESANSWRTWRSYVAGFYFLYLSLFLFALGFIKQEVTLMAWYVIAPCMVTALAACLSWYWRQRYSYEDEPTPAWFAKRKERVRRILKISESDDQP